MRGLRLLNRNKDKRVTCSTRYPFFYVRRFLRISGLIALCGFAGLSVQAEEMGEVSALFQSGAHGLALYVLDQQQAPSPVELETWMQQERVRVQIYQSTGNWKALIAKLQILPEGLPDEFGRWAKTRLAEALINNAEGPRALAVLRELIWNLPNEPALQQQWLLTWRRMVIQAYLAGKFIDDARNAASRLHRDYPELELADLILRARILLSTEHADEVIDILADKTAEPEAGMLYLLAQLRSQARSPKKVVQAGLRQMRGDWVEAGLKAHLWAVVAEAAQGSGDRATTANALEHVLAEHKNGLATDNLFAFDADALWNAYLDFAVSIGNQAQYLIGADEQWFKAAEDAGNKQPVRARSLYALLILKGQQPQSRQRAVKNFILSMNKREQGERLLKRLFLDSKIFPSYAAIPESARHALADIALAESNIELASALMATIQEPPEGMDQFFWHLRRARILVLGGNAEEGAKALTNMLAHYETLEKEQLDRLMQVIFDLQTVGLHQDAYALFLLVLNKTAEQNLHREIYYWMAESLKADRNYAEAARLFLKSAMLPDPKAMDPWAQTARYQAAEALAKAGLVDDARNLFQQLLSVTKDAGRRAVLQRELQKLWLVDNKKEN